MPRRWEKKDPIEHAAYMREWRSKQRESRRNAWLEEHETMEFLLFCCEAGIEPSPRSCLDPRALFRYPSARRSDRKEPFVTEAEPPDMTYTQKKFNPSRF